MNESDQIQLDYIEEMNPDSAEWVNGVLDELVTFIEKGRFSFVSTHKSQMEWFLETTDIIDKYKNE